MANSNIMNPYFSQFNAKRLYLKSHFFRSHSACQIVSFAFFSSNLRKRLSLLF